MDSSLSDILLILFIAIQDYHFNKSSIQRDAVASLGMRQSPLGDRETEPTLGPSGIQLLLNCCEKNRLKKFPAALRTSSEVSSGYALRAYATVLEGSKPYLKV